MEERLREFLSTHESLAEDQECNAVLSFLHLQLVQLASDCLQKSTDKLITRTYFYQLLNNLERLLMEVGAVCVVY